MKFFLCILTASVALFSAFFSALSTPNLNVGVIVPLTGPFASSGQTFKNSILLAQQHVDPQKTVSFIFEDSQMEPKVTITALNKLIERDHIAGVIVWGSPTSMAVNTIAERAKLPMISITMLDAVVQNKKFVLKHWIRVAPLMEQTIAEAQKRSYNKVAIATLMNDATLKQRDLFVESNTAQIVVSEEFDKSENDFRSFVTKVKHAQPDAVYLLVWPPQLSTIARQLRASGYKGAFFGAQSLEDPHELAAAQGALEGAWFFTTDDSSAQPYYEEYHKVYHELPAAGGTHAYDIARIMIEGAGHHNLNEYLHTIKNFSGVLGTYSVTTNGDFSIPLLLKCIKGGAITSEHCQS